MSSLDGQNLFGSSPHTIKARTWQRAITRRGFSGVDGEFALDQGLRSRVIIQTGRLQSDAAASLGTLILQIEDFIDGQLHTLIDNYSHTYQLVLVENFEPTTPVKHGRGYWCDYEIRYRQLS